MLLDAVAVFGLSVLSMVAREGAPPWPTYTLSAYLLSFTVSTLIFLAAFYFGGLYEREPRLGGAAVLPKAARLSLAAGSFVALLNLAMSEPGARVCPEWCSRGRGRPRPPRAPLGADPRAGCAGRGRCRG